MVMFAVWVLLTWLSLMAAVPLLLIYLVLVVRVRRTASRARRAA